MLMLPYSNHASVIETPLADTEGYTTFNWSGDCSDCLSFKGDDSFNFAETVTGNMIFDGYVSGERFEFDQRNIVSFQYDGPSDHIDKLVVHNANFSSDDAWEDDNELWPLGFTVDIAGAYLNPDAVINGYTHFGENMTALGWLSADLTSYSLDLTFDTLVAIDDETGEYIPFSSLSGDESEVTMFRKDTFRILFESNGNWSISVNNQLNDIGNDAQIAVADVPEPKTVLLFSLAIIAICRKRVI